MIPPKKWGKTRDGEWVRLGMKTRKAFGCCDCGLVHWVVLRQSGERFYVSFERDQQLTEKVRRKRRDGRKG